MSNSTPSLKGKTIRMFWVNTVEEWDNLWFKGTVISGRMASNKLYKVEFYDTLKSFVRLVDLDNKFMKPFWQIVSSATEDQLEIDRSIKLLNTKIVEEHETHWLQCENGECNMWHELPNGLSPDRFDEPFTCKSVIWDKKVIGCKYSGKKLSSSSNNNQAASNIELSEYEKKRLLNVQRNRNALEVLFPSEERFQSLFNTSSNNSSSNRNGSDGNIIEKNDTSAQHVRKKRKSTMIDGVDLSAFIETRQSSRGQIQRTEVFQPADFRNRKKRNPRRDCPVVFKGNLAKSNYKIEKGSDLVIEWEMEDPRSARGGYIYLAQKHGRVDDLYVICAEIDATTAAKQLFTFTLPLHVPVSKDYFVEIANVSPRCYGKSELFELDDPVGFCLESDIGVWCCGCATTKHYVGKQGYKGNWLTCSVCHSWQHEDCYTRKYIKKADFVCLFCNLNEQLFSNEQDANEESIVVDNDVVINHQTSLISNHLSSTITSEATETVDMHMEKDINDDSIISTAASNNTISNNSVVSHNTGNMFLLQPLSSSSSTTTPTTATTTTSMQLLSQTNDKNHSPSKKKQRRGIKKMIETMLNMISQTARYRRKYTKLCSTPDHVALFLKKVLMDYGMAAEGKDQKIIDLGAGHGALTKILPEGSIAVEILENRYKKGKTRAPKSTWVNQDIFSSSFYDQFLKNSMNTFDYVVSNPDFEVALQTIFISLFLLKRGCKMYFLLPSDFFEASPPRTRVYKILNCTIEKEYKLGHLAFYEDNRNAQKLSTDSIFVLSHGREKKYEYTVMNSRLAGMLRTSS